MLKLSRSFFSNFLASRLGSLTPGHALFPLYHLTPDCNLHCSYCEGFSEKELPPASRKLNPAEIRKLLEIVRRRFSIIFFTGGEPLILGGIEDIFRHARELGYRHISVNTNMLLFHEHTGILPHLDHIVASLDSLSPEINDRIVGRVGATEQIVRNLLLCSSLREKHNFALTVHCVASPGLLAEAEKVLDFCLENRIHFCFSPRQKDYQPDPGLIGDREYREFISRLIRAKRKTGLISGGYQFYENIRDFTAFRCYPWLIPRIFPNGDLIFPCRPRGRAVGNLLESGSWEVLERRARAGPGRDFSCDRSCRIRCYIEPSLFAPHPLRTFREFVFHR